MRKSWAVVILLLAGIVSYANTAGNWLFWDDDEFITRNAYIRSFRYLPEWFSQPLTAGAGVNSNYYRPLLQLSFAIDYQLWKLWPAGYHIENMLWHTTAGILLFVFFAAFLRDFKFQTSSFKLPKAVAFTTALLWLVHPVHVEAVAYANSRGDSMATVLILLSLILWQKKRFWPSAVAFMLALLSKEFAIVTPGLILLTQFIQPIKEIPSRTRRNLLIIFAIAATYILLRLTVLNFQNTLDFYGLDLSKVDPSQPIVRYAMSLPVRLLTFLKVLPVYGKILVWPVDLHMERTVDIPASILDPAVLSAIGELVVVGVLIYWSLIILKQRLALFAVGWFFIAILPVSGVIPISQILAEHFLYLPSIGFFILVSWTLVFVIRQRIFLFLVFSFLFLALLSKTISQNRVWRDPITFYEYTLSKTTPTARVYNNLAMAYADLGKHQKAINNYRAAIAMGDVYPNPHYNLGNTFVDLEKLDEAEREYKRALEIDPSFHYATLKLGQLYIDQGKINEAKKLVCPVFPTQPLCRQ